MMRERLNRRVVRADTSHYIMNRSRLLTVQLDVQVTCAFQSAPEEPTRLRPTDVSSRIEESSL
jgi:hypothetical protein